jgi:hypothetical protein
MLATGLLVGLAVGTAVGSELGTEEGEGEGLLLGVSVGDTDGSAVGLALGELDGSLLGLSEATFVGLSDGLGDGIAVAVVGAGDTGPEVVVARVSSVLHPPPVSIRNELLGSISSSLHCRDPLSTASFIALVINASFSSIPAVPVFTYKIDEA